VAQLHQNMRWGRNVWNYFDTFLRVHWWASPFLAGRWPPRRSQVPRRHGTRLPIWCTRPSWLHGVDFPEVGSGRIGSEPFANRSSAIVGNMVGHIILVFVIREAAEVSYIADKVIVYFFPGFWTRGLCHKTHYRRNLRISVIS